jgi:hypothetical protein
MFDGPPNDHRWMTETYHYNWQYSRSGREITVTGESTDELGGRIKRKTLPRERFCYRVDKHQFQHCH